MGFLSKLFGPKERPLTGVVLKMEAYTKVASGVMVFMLMEDVGVDRSTDQTEREHLATRAGYQAKILLSEPLDSPKYRSVSGDIEAMNATVFMEKTPLMMELVVQTLRVKNSIYFAKYGEAKKPPIGIDVLEHYGSKVKTEPDPDNFDALLRQVFDSMSTIGKARMDGFMKDLGLTN